MEKPRTHPTTLFLLLLLLLAYFKNDDLRVSNQQNDGKDFEFDETTVERIRKRDDADDLESIEFYFEEDFKSVSVDDRTSLNK